jgi:hypothetical protein
MGVDIPDIQVVYHHAPSGLLPDYIQEIGRAARKEHIHGFAALTFSKADLRYSKQLFGLSSLKPFQLQEVLKKIIRCYNNNNRKRNMLIATSDFAYIFDSEEELDQKVSTALMMIEKDYLIKTRFNVLIARPKKLFSKVFARTTDIGIDKLSKLYGSCYNEILNPYGNYHTIELNLEEIWSNHFSDKSFPKIKSEFYKQSFLQEHNIELTPLVKITLKIDSDFTKTYGEFSSFLESVCKVFAYFRRLNHFFTQDEFEDVFCQLLGNKINSNKLATFLLGTYSGNRTVTNTLEGDSFLQERKVGTLTQYQKVLILDEYNEYYFVSFYDQTFYVKKDEIRKIADSHLELDISEQKVYMYIDGELILEADTITGHPNKGTTHGTNLGISQVYSKSYDVTFEGGKQSKYFILFNWDGEGFHDANWREDWEYEDKERYIIAGSNGCSNMKEEDVVVIEQNCYIGMPVLIHK